MKIILPMRNGSKWVPAHAYRNRRLLAGLWMYLKDRWKVFHA